MKNFIKKNNNESERNGFAYALDKVKADDGFVSESRAEESTDRIGSVEGWGLHLDLHLTRLGRRNDNNFLGSEVR
ncbi:hypothetical protein PanWU01x14_339460 [Parasponia andersonii]|uniref:Uncharacterized protein n=1 Tax=Parasponia andersonii TaxID=3476 RepID=A0A2P5AEQ9_PARAD|nr:hypothetical protein PanWU01x14_339460 [Parasponia andersonii]